MSGFQLKGAFGKKDSALEANLNLAERIYRLQVIKQLIRERHMAHGADEYNESKHTNKRHPMYMIYGGRTQSTLLIKAELLFAL